MMISASAVVYRRGWKTKTAMWKKDLFRFSGKQESVEQSLPQVEKISKLILGEIRQIRNIVEKERCQVSPAETGSNNGVVVASSTIVKSEIKERPSCNFDRREQSAEVEKLRAEPETFFCCCSWPRTGRLWWFFSYCCFHCDLKIVVDQQCYFVLVAATDLGFPWLEAGKENNRDPDFCCHFFILNLSHICIWKSPFGNILKIHWFCVGTTHWEVVPEAQRYTVWIKQLLVISRIQMLYICRPLFGLISIKQRSRQNSLFKAGQCKNKLSTFPTYPIHFNSLQCSNGAPSKIARAV